MSADRCTGVIAGPATVATPDITMVTQGDVIVDITRNFRAQETSLHGEVGRVLEGQVVSIRFAPKGDLAYLPYLFPFQPSNIGDEMFGCSDEYLRIHGQDGIRLELKAGAIFQPPPIRIARNRDLFGDCEFRAVVANDTDLSDANALYEISSTSFTAPTGAADAPFNRTATWSWGASSPYTDVESEDGYEFQVRYGANERALDTAGIIGAKLASVEATCQFKPQGLTLAQVMAMMSLDGSANSVPGTAALSLSNAFTVVTGDGSAGNLSCAFAKAFVERSGHAWGRNVGRFNGGITMRAAVSVTTGDINPLFAFAEVPEGT